jgi:hypothetical protein
MERISFIVKQLLHWKSNKTISTFKKYKAGITKTGLTSYFY